MLRDTQAVGSGSGSDPDLALAASNGDRRALELLLERHAEQIHAICRRIVRDDSDALDATQEAMLAIVRGIDRFDGRSAFTTWMYRVATNAALDETRRRSRRPRPSELAEDIADPSSAPERAVEARIDVHAALARLPEDFRIAVVLRDLENLDYREIADVLDVPIGTIRSRIARGRALLARILGNHLTPDERPTG